MTDLKFTSSSGETTIKFEETGRLGTVAPKTQLHIKMDEPVQYEIPMTENEEEIEEVKAQIKVLEKKLSFLEELEKTKSPVEEAFKDNYGVYPNELKTTDDFNCWKSFKRGYVAAQKDYKVGEYQEPEEELKTLFQMLNDKNNHPETCAFVCNIVKRWMSQYTHNVMTGEYLKGYEECLTVLEENLE